MSGAASGSGPGSPVRDPALRSPKPPADVPALLAFFRDKLESDYMRNLLERDQAPTDGK